MILFFKTIIPLEIVLEGALRTAHYVFTHCCASVLSLSGVRMAPRLGHVTVGSVGNESTLIVSIGDLNIINSSCSYEKLLETDIVIFVKEQQSNKLGENASNGAYQF